MEYTRSSPGSLFFNEDGIAGCPKCGWRGIPTFGNDGCTPRVASLRAFGDRRFLPRTIVPHSVDHRCPSCEHDPDPSFRRDHYRRRPNASKKRKAAKAARRRNR